MPNPSKVRSGLFGSTLSKLADNAAAFFNGMIGKENIITGVHVEVTGGVVAIGIAAYALSRPDIRNSLYQMALGLINVQVAHHSVVEERKAEWHNQGMQAEVVHQPFVAGGTVNYGHRV